MKIAKVLKPYLKISSVSVDKKKTKVFQMSNEMIIPKATATKVTPKKATQISKKTVIKTNIV
jgi:hypothetical protein